jgi:hypothetical protein
LKSKGRKKEDFNGQLVVKLPDFYPRIIRPMSI